VPRGSLIFNAETIYGMVVYTGRDTKLAFHLRQPEWKAKRVPILEDLLDKAFLVLIYAILPACVIIYLLPRNSSFENASILYLANGTSIGRDRQSDPFVWLMTFQKCIPISLILLLAVIMLFISWGMGRGSGQAPSYKVGA
jgi:magnesium-transporting ATPase (P-type)